MLRIRRPPGFRWKLVVGLAVVLAACTSRPTVGGWYSLSSQDRNHPSSGFTFHGWVENRCKPGCGVSAAFPIKVNVSVEPASGGGTVLEADVPADKPNWHPVPPGSYVVRTKALEGDHRCPITDPIDLERHVTLTVELYCE